MLSDIPRPTAGIGPVRCLAGSYDAATGGSALALLLYGGKVGSMISIMPGGILGRERPGGGAAVLVVRGG